VGTVVTEGEPAPDFALPSETGEIVSLSDFRGKPVAVPPSSRRSGRSAPTQRPLRGRPSGHSQRGMPL